MVFPSAMNGRQIQHIAGKPASFSFDNRQTDGSRKLQRWKVSAFAAQHPQQDASGYVMLCYAVQDNAGSMPKSPGMVPEFEQGQGKDWEEMRCLLSELVEHVERLLPKSPGI